MTRQSRQSQKTEELQGRPRQLEQELSASLRTTAGFPRDLEGFFGQTGDGINCLKWITTAVGILARKERIDTTTS